LEHANHNAIQTMATNVMVEGMPCSFTKHPCKCDNCILRKQIHTPVPNEHTHDRAVRRMDIIYVDLTGPEDVASAIGNLYLMNIIDDYLHF
ncbi:hypothetical protein BDN71DRAFT_1370657, partial [Pleurotus eryngii]